MQQFYWHIELASKCFLKCPRCIRQDPTLKDKWTDDELSLSFIKKTFTPDYIRNNMKRILFCGVNGDPIYCKDFLKILKYFKEIKPDITLSIVTNGSYKNKEWWYELSQILDIYDIITFSIDGWDDESNNIYRVNSNFKSILNGIEIITKHSNVHIAWSTILFKFNQDKINQIEEVAKENNIQYFQLSFSALFGSKNKKFINEEGYDPLEPGEKYISGLKFLYKKYLKQINNNKSHNEYIESLAQDYKNIILKNYEKEKTNYITPLCKIGNKGLYIDSSGILYPCSWIANPYIDNEDSLFVKHKNEFDLNKNNIEEILSNKFWKKIENSWEDKKNNFKTCEQHCLTEYTNNNIIPERIE